MLLDSNFVVDREIHEIMSVLVRRTSTRRERFTRARMWTLALIDFHCHSVVFEEDVLAWQGDGRCPPF